MPSLQELRALKALKTSKPKIKMHESLISRINKFLKECPLEIFDGNCIHGSDYDSTDPTATNFFNGEIPAYCTCLTINIGQSFLRYHIEGSLDRKVGEVDCIILMLFSRMEEDEGGNPIALYKDFEYDFKTGQFETENTRLPTPNRYLKMILADLENP